ncbi:hypothetical protein ACWIGM_17725 [Bosea sp. NPDC055332]
MTIALVIVVPAYLVVASLIALTSAFEAERPALAATDLAVIALVSVAWPIVGCAMLSAQAGRKLFQ